MLKKYLGSDFIRNILTLMTGAAIALAIPFLASPLLTRLYTPEDFGIFGTYSAIVTSIVVVASLRYELAIMLPKKDRDAESLAFLSGMLTVAISLITFLAILIFSTQLIAYKSELKHFLWIVPLGLFFSGAFTILNSYSTRHKLFKTTSGSKVAQSGTAVGSQIGLNFFRLSSIGLIAGKVIGDVVAFFLLLIVNLRKKTISIKNFNWQSIKENAVRYKDFPKFQALSAFLSQFSQNLPPLLLTFLYAPEIAGFYVLSMRVVGSSIRMVGLSTREVYYQKASEMYANRENIFRLYMKTTLGLAKIGIVPFILVGVFAVSIFTFVFGEQWETAGVYTQIIIFWAFFTFINVPTTSTIYILNLQKFGLKFEVVSVLLRGGGLLAGYYFFDNHYYSLAFFVLAGILLNVYLILYIYRKLKVHSKQISN